jgi:hypothetical protein
MKDWLTASHDADKLVPHASSMSPMHRPVLPKRPLPPTATHYSATYGRLRRMLKWDIKRSSPPMVEFRFMRI